MTLKLPQLQSFMTNEDERAFSKALKDAMPELVFIDAFYWPDPEPRISETLAETQETGPQTPSFCILNTKIISLEHYKAHYVWPIDWPTGRFYQGTDIGPGMIQYICSEKWTGGGHEGWANGRLAASYDLEAEPETDAYVKAVYKIFKKGALKLRYLNAETKEVHERPTSVFFAWPNAVQKYDQVNNQYLINNTMAYLTSKKAFIEQN